MIFPAHILLLSFQSVLTWVLLVGYFMLIVTLIVAVLSENRNPLKALGWVTALLLFPIGGVVLYLVFGRSMRNVKMISRRNRRRLLNSGQRPAMPRFGKMVSTDNCQRIQLGYNIAEAPVYQDNVVEIFNEGAPMFERMLTDIRNAGSYIYFQFYIIANDSLGRKVSDALIERAKAGVRIKVIYDYVGSFGSLSQNLFARLRANGIEVHSFFRIQFPEQLGRLNWRNHRKAVIIDGHTGYIGGMNVASRYVDGGRQGHWRDLAIRITGPAVLALQHNFAIDWKFMGHALLTDEPTGTPLPSSDDSLPGIMAQIIASGPTNRWGNTHMLFLKAISGARRRVYLQTPYFLPSEGLLSALQCAALSGVDVRIMMPRRSDSSILTNASASFIEESLLAGIKVYMYEPGMLHSKMLLVDDDFVTLGSTNFDYRSFEHNFEENIVLYSREANQAIAALFKEDQKNSTLVRLSEWNQRPTLCKARESLSRLFSPIL